ncbi:MAG: leucyl aminopeptidase [Negativicutes bacterium]|nr:leucyl aminopeptidase [Negativicutes bacterium]
MQIEVIAGSLNEVLCDTLIIFTGSEAEAPTGIARDIDNALQSQISRLLLDQPELGKFGEINVLHTLGLMPAKRVIIAGIGKDKDFDAEKLRALMGNAARAVVKYDSRIVATYVSHLPVEARQATQAVVEGLILGAYQFNEYKTEKKPVKKIEKLYLAIPHSAERESLQAIAYKAKIIAESVNFTRDLVNHPASAMTPSHMADYANAMAQQYGLEATIFAQTEIDKLKMHAFLAVAQGSAQPPKLIMLRYTGNTAASEYTALIGKGITFDSGGISLKPSEGMDEMKTDMAGGAAVLGAMRAIAQLKPKVNLLAIVPCAENMPSGTAIKPGDVISSMAGKSIEIVNTDAEGRLLLADALTYAKHLGANKLVDIATLTGACVVALGSVASGVISNHDGWCNKVLGAAAQSGEKMWRLPAYDEYKEQIKSPIADLKNSGGRPAGAITAGLFLAAFAGETPWAHIDIAGTATINKDSGYNPKGATGAGVRTLIQLAQDLAQP